MAFVPLATAAIGALSKTATALPNQSASDQLVSTGIDFSDWTVSTGSSKANGATDNNGLSIPPWLILGAVALAAVVIVRWNSKK